MKIILIIIFNIFFLLNINAQEYITSNVNSPLFKQKYELQLGGFMGTGGIQFQSAFTLTNHIAILYDYSIGKQTYNLVQDYIIKQHNIMAGVYANYSEFGRLELFAGYGSGKILTDSTSSFNKIILQPTLGFSSAFFDMGLSPRVIYLAPEDNNQRIIFIEPALKVGFGVNNFYFTGNVFYSLISYKAFDNQAFEYAPYGFSGGLIYKFGNNKSNKLNYN